MAVADALNKTSTNSPSTVPARTALSRRCLASILAPIHQLAGRCANLKVLNDLQAETCQCPEFPRFAFLGPAAGDEPLKVGIFAGIHGDEPEGVHALLRFASLLEREPDIAEGFWLFLYPVCNPEGFEDRRRNARSGKDLNREFWRGSQEPAVKLLEAELIHRKFQGLISLHTDDSAAGFYGYARGTTLTQNLIEPALAAAEQFLPIDRSERIDGFPARNGVITAAYPGMLSAPPGTRPQPFEIVLETPHSAPNYLKEAALVAALRVVLVRYRQFIAYASNI